MNYKLIHRSSLIYIFKCIVLIYSSRTLMEHYEYTTQKSRS